MEIIQWLQSFRNPAADLVWSTITFLSSEEFFLFCVPLFFWCFNSKKGWLLFNLMVTAVVSNVIIRNLIAEPRPSPDQVQVLMTETTSGEMYGFPSGHTEFATVFWGYLALQLGRWFWWIAAIMITILVAISRLYLGLHWPVDVIGGFIFGVIILGLGWVADTRWSSAAKEHPPIGALVISILLPFLIFAFYPTDTSARALGFLTAFNFGYLVLVLWFEGKFPVKTTLLKQISKVAIGMVVLILLRTLLKDIFPDTVVFHFLRYAIMGFWAGFLAPTLFKVLFSEQQGLLKTPN